ncbi:hypothetical protein MRX96_058517 [Rhipicephalus microplus]
MWRLVCGRLLRLRGRATPGFSGKSFWQPITGPAAPRDSGLLISCYVRITSCRRHHGGRLGVVHRHDPMNNGLVRVPRRASFSIEEKHSQGRPNVFDSRSGPRAYAGAGPWRETETPFGSTGAHTSPVAANARGGRSFLG